MLQVPVVTKLTTKPETVHVESVVDVRVTVSPELALTVAVK